MRRWVIYITIAAVLATPVAVVMGMALITVIYGSSLSSQNTFTCQAGAGAVLIPAELTGNVAPFDSPEQKKNAGIIIGAGITHPDITEEDRIVALMTAMQEAGLLNLDYGDRDSLGLFQQRTSQGWGTPSQIMDPTYASNKFYDALVAVKKSNPQAFARMSFTQRAQAVQHSGFPRAYAKWEDEARTMMAGSGVPQGTDAAQAATADLTCTSPNETVEVAVQAALSQVGEPYVWGGGDTNGPTLGGFDCSGLMEFAYAQAGIGLPGDSRSQWQAGEQVSDPRQNIQRGDLVYWAHNISDPDTVYHVALYLGGDQVIEAYDFGMPVDIYPMRWNEDFIGATRPAAGLPAQAGAPQDGWQLPVDPQWPITSDYGYRPDPINGEQKLHNGTDFGAPGGAPVYAVANGIVQTATSCCGWGNHVVIDHGGGVTTLSAHFESIAPGIQPGATVSKGAIIGYVGNTGRVTGYHLHFTVEVDGEAVHPVQFLRQHGVTL